MSHSVRSSKRHAEIVLRHAQQDGIYIDALRLLGREQEADLSVPVLRAQDVGGPAIVIVPLGQVDILLLKDLLPVLRKELGLPVVLASVEVKLPVASRTPTRDFFAAMCKAIGEQSDHWAIRKALAEAKTDLASIEDMELMEMYVNVLRQHGQDDQAQKLARRVRQLQALGDQWNARELLEALAPVTRSVRDNSVKFVAITRHDIYSEDSNFLFAFTQDNTSIVSYRRFLSLSPEMAPTRQRLRDRLLKQLLTSSGKVFGLGNCLDPSCARSFSIGIEQQDAKDPTMCESCRKELKAALAKYRRTPEPMGERGQRSTQPTTLP